MSIPHPEMAAILLAQQAAPLPNPETLPIATARENFNRNNVAWNLPLPPMAAQDMALGGVPCRLLTPRTAPAGLVVFVHGGGWTFGSPATHERFARLLAERSGAAFLLPDYRLAPEHPAPAAIEDVLAVIAGLDGISPPGTPIILAGDSAGANIALAAALSATARPIAMLSLLYGCFAPRFETPSHVRNGDGRFGLGTQRMRWYWRNWQGAAPDPRSAPLDAALSDLAALPPCHLLAAALDPLCDDSLRLADRLAEAGVATRLDIVPGVVHGFLQMTGRLGPARRATALIAREIAAAFQPEAF
jgi:acetyl esterase